MIKLKGKMRYLYSYMKNENNQNPRVDYGAYSLL